MKCTKCGSELKDEAKFCGECGQRVTNIELPEGEFIALVNKDHNECKNLESGATTTTTTQNGFKRYIKPLAIFAVILIIIFAVASRRSDEREVYELIPEILEEFECGLGYGKPQFPEFESDDIIITDLNYKQSAYDDVYDMFYVDGIVTITTAFGTKLDLDYQMRVGLDEEFEETGKWYAEIIDGDVFG